MGQAHVQFFAERVAERRRALGLTILDVNENGGPTAPTVVKAEAGELQDPRPSTLSKFDVGLRWMPGSAARTYWDGLVPRPLEHAGKNGQPLEPGAASVALPLDTVLDLMNAQSRLHDLLENRANGAIAATELEPIVQALNQQISSIVGRFVTDLLERNHAGSRQEMQPLIEFAFKELLSAPVSVEDPDRDEKLYRRWLLGQPYDLPPALEVKFRNRLRRKGAYRRKTNDETDG